MNLLGVDKVQSCSFEDTIPVKSGHAPKNTINKIKKSLILHPEEIQMKVDGDQTVT